MSGFIEGESRTQTTLFPESMDDYVEVKYVCMGGITPA